MERENRKLSDRGQRTMRIFWATAALFSYSAISNTPLLSDMGLARFFLSGLGIEGPPESELPPGIDKITVEEEDGGIRTTTISSCKYDPNNHRFRQLVTERFDGEDFSASAQWEEPCAGDICEIPDWKCY